jgi:hypothetical protein
MRALRKTRLKKNVAQVFSTTQKVILLTIGYGNCRAVETVENELHVFHRSHRAWKTRQLRSSFPQFPQPLMLDIVLEKKRKQPLSKNGLDKMQSKA